MPSENLARHDRCYTYRLTEKSRGEEGEDPKRSLVLLHKTLLQTFSFLFLSLVFLVFSRVSTTEPEDPLYIEKNEKKKTFSYYANP